MTNSTNSTNSSIGPAADDGRWSRLLCSLHRGLWPGIVWFGAPAPTYLWRALLRDRSDIERRGPAR
ncbi:hypothetical protein [Kribbella caucasensis]|uniref:hypothetical protein n=1 Tax=Kribbella caucasensis TaxID=2512215 RepID=UPI00141521CB|nr:hypothetical protein [Kribbella sp. VKM Ac-2527]